MAKSKKEETQAQIAEIPQEKQQMPSYDELMAAYNDLRMRSDRNDVITRLQFDFLALEHTKELPKNYVNAVIRDVMTLLPMQDVDIDAEIKALGKKASK
jgi:hypothetical protein